MLMIVIPKTQCILQNVKTNYLMQIVCQNVQLKKIIPCIIFTTEDIITFNRNPG